MIYYLALIDQIVTNHPFRFPPLSNDIAALNTLATYAIENGSRKTPKEYLEGMVNELLQKG